MHISVTFPESSTFPERTVGGYASPGAVCEVSRDNQQVSVSFRLDCNEQDTGDFTVSPQVARWLAYALLAAADGFSDRYPIIARIENDQIDRNA